MKLNRTKTIWSSTQKEFHFNLNFTRTPIPKHQIPNPELVEESNRKSQIVNPKS
jgi:hypothetical protein